MNDDFESEDKRFWQQMTAILVLAALAVVGWIITKHFLQRPDRMEEVEKMPMSHPTFGMIYLASATDISAMGQGRGPRGNPIFVPPEMLSLGTNTFYWNVPAANRGERGGVLYVWGMGLRITNNWTVAPCSKHDLADVTPKDLETEFIAMNDEVKGRAAFGGNWIDSNHGRVGGTGVHGISVKEGDILLLRATNNPSTTYVLEMTRMGDGEIRARYLEIRK